MRKPDAPFRPCAGLPPRLELVLRLPDGSPWPLSVTAGMERFIGCYPRVDGIGCGGPLLSFRVTDPA